MVLWWLLISTLVDNSMWAQNLLRLPTFILHHVYPTFCTGFSQISLRSSLASHRLVKGNSYSQGWPSVNRRYHVPVSQSLRWTGLGSVSLFSIFSRVWVESGTRAHENAHVYQILLFLTSASWDYLPNKQPTIRFCFWGNSDFQISLRKERK